MSSCLSDSLAMLSGLCIICAVITAAILTTIQDITTVEVTSNSEPIADCVLPLLSLA